MLMPSFLYSVAIFGDAARWWGFVGAALTVPDLTRTGWQWLRTRRWAEPLAPRVQVPMQALTTVFILFAGFFLPLMTRVAGVNYRAPWFVVMVAGMWAALGSAPWVYVVGTAERPRYMLAALVVMWWSCVTAAVVTFDHL